MIADNTKWKFLSEAGGVLPTPPELSFADAFEELDSVTNSFFILEHGDDYIQCGGSNSRCTIEVRQYSPDGSFRHFVFFDPEGSDEPAHIKMSGGGVYRSEKHCFESSIAIELFDRFFKSEPWPTDIELEDITSSFD